MYNHLHALIWKKRLRIVNPIGNRVSNSLFSIEFWIRHAKIFIRYCPCGFNFHDLFFIRYFIQKVSHYKRDVIPVLERWCNLSTTLEFHIALRSESFHNMYVNIIQSMLDLDPRSVARCHLSVYHHSDHRSFDMLDRDVRRYNDMVTVFINHVSERIELFLKSELPYLRQYNQTEDQKSNFYHYSNILYYFWLVYWQSRDGRNEVHPQISHYGNADHPRINTGGDPLASSDNMEDIRRLYAFLTTMAPDIIDWLARLNVYRNEVIEYYNVFRHNIEYILDDQSWTHPIRGRCGWERQYFSMTR
jgi:hypothetical protein